jgi:septal ring factor EnvC (AmiA/AmiB activator)
MTMTFEQMQELLANTMLLTQRNSESISRLEQELRETRSIVDSNARAIQANNNALDTKFNQIADAVIRGQDRLERLERRDRKVDKEIRGLRIETRRILERWLGAPFPDDPDLDDEVE